MAFTFLLMMSRKPVLIHDSHGHAASITCLAFVAQKHKASFTQVCACAMVRVHVHLIMVATPCACRFVVVNRYPSGRWTSAKMCESTLHCVRGCKQSHLSAM